ncbi:MAG: hypothetical protein HZY76_21410 [Anaerolineae bacterium]|nr:MAG: hypothetical protein HZY76_21410 [Anaerolineae bacterium]
MQRDLPLVPASKVRVIYPGVPDWHGAAPSSVTRTGLGLQPDHPVIGYFGTFMPVRRRVSAGRLRTGRRPGSASPAAADG